MPRIISSPTTSADSLQQEIQAALRESDPVLANLKITRCHYLLAQALQQVAGRGGGGQLPLLGGVGLAQGGGHHPVGRPGPGPARRLHRGECGGGAGGGGLWLAAGLGTRLATRGGAAGGRVRPGRGALYYSAQPAALDSAQPAALGQFDSGRQPHGAGRHWLANRPVCGLANPIGRRAATGRFSGRFARRAG